MIEREEGRTTVKLARDLEVKFTTLDEDWSLMDLNGWRRVVHTSCQRKFRPSGSAGWRDVGIPGDVPADYEWPPVLLVEGSCAHCGAVQPEAIQMLYKLQAGFKK